MAISVERSHTAACAIFQARAIIRLEVCQHLRWPQICHSSRWCRPDLVTSTRRLPAGDETGKADRHGLVWFEQDRARRRHFGRSRVAGGGRAGRGAARSSAAEFLRGRVAWLAVGAAEAASLRWRGACRRSPPTLHILTWPTTTARAGNRPIGSVIFPIRT